MRPGLSRVSGNAAPSSCLSSFLPLPWLPALCHGFSKSPVPWGCIGQLPLPSLLCRQADLGPNPSLTWSASLFTTWSWVTLLGLNVLLCNIKDGDACHVGFGGK